MLRRMPFLHFNALFVPFSPFRPFMSAWQEITAPAPFRLWRVTLGEMPSPEALATLSPTEHQRARRFVFEPHRCRYLGAHVALREILASLTGVAAVELAFDTGPFGKPSLMPERCAFNLSDSADVAVVLAAPRGDIGVDVEVPRRVTDALALAERFFTRAEFESVADAPAIDRDRVFLRHWTRKEACLKAVGSGLSISPETFEAGNTDEPFDTTIRTPRGSVVVRVQSLPETADGLQIAVAEVVSHGGPQPL